MRASEQDVLGVQGDTVLGARPEADHVAGRERQDPLDRQIDPRDLGSQSHGGRREGAADPGLEQLVGLAALAPGDAVGDRIDRDPRDEQSERRGMLVHPDLDDHHEGRFGDRGDRLASL